MVKFLDEYSLQRGSLGKKKVIDKVEYKGNFRITGTIMRDGEIVGYVVANTKNYEQRFFTVTQTMALLQKSKFENAEISDGEVYITECSIGRLPVYDTNRNKIGNDGIIIVGRIVSRGRNLGFRILDEKGRVLDIPEERLIQHINNTGVTLINAKLISETSSVKQHISAIRGNFKVIERSVVVESDKYANMITEDGGNSVEKYHKLYLQKLVYAATKKVVRWAGGSKVLPTKKKDLKIILDEYVFKKYPLMKQCRNSDIANIITAAIMLDISMHGKLILHPELVGEERAEEMWYILVRNYLKEKIKMGRKIKNGMYKPFDDSLLSIIKQYDVTGDVYKFALARDILVKQKSLKVNLHEDHFVRPIIWRIIRAMTLEDLTLREKAEITGQLINERVEYNTAKIPYTDTLGIAYFGFTIDPALTGQVFKSPIYGYKRLKYIFEDIAISESEKKEVLELINCFGDLEILRKVDRLGDFYDTDEKLLFYKMCIFILAMHNPEFAHFVHNKYYYDEIPFDIDEISVQDFFLDEDDIIYYQSGMKFGFKASLLTNQSWMFLTEYKSKEIKSLNTIPRATYEALAVHLGGGNTLLWKQTPSMKYDIN